MKKKIFTLLTLAVGLGAIASAQSLNTYQIAAHVAVEKGTHSMSAPFSGGFNTPQFATADLNGDGKMDLVTFEGYGRKGVRTYINEGVAGAPIYKYAPQYEAPFPELFIFMIMADYNRDGVMDLFHAGVAGFYIFKGYYANGMLHFSFVKDLRYGGPNGETNNAYVGNSTIPGIIDVDGDGDLDFFSYSISGMRILYYRNMQEEYGLPRDTIRVRVESGCWGSTLQPTDRTTQLGVDQRTCDTNYLIPPSSGPYLESGTVVYPPATAAKGTMHGTNSLCFLDVDGDGDVDYLNGNEAFNDIQLLKNGRADYGWWRDTIVAQDTLWQSNGKMYYLNTYPTAYHIDYNGDGVKDLLIAPHGTGSRNRNQVWYYQNNGTSSAPNFAFTTDSLLSNDIIDVGSKSRPLFYDFNKDGKLDLIIGGMERMPDGRDIPRLQYYENITTTIGSPKYRFVTNDLIDISIFNVYATEPAIGDVDGDGLDDLLLGRADGKLMYFRNTASSASVPPVWTLADLAITRDGTDPISVWAGASPAFYDINKDGKSDLIIGQADGTLTAYLNTNTVRGTVSFGQPIDTFGGVRIPDYDTTWPSIPLTLRYSKPFIGKIQAGSNQDYLLMGGIYGRLYVWDSIGTGNVHQRLPLVADTFSGLSLHDYTAPAVADMDGDGQLEMVVGNDLGGLLLYWTGKPTSTNSVIEKAAVRMQVFPNPAKEAFSIQISGNKSLSESLITVTDITGRMVFREKWLAGKETGNIAVQHWSAGTYLVSVANGTGVQTQKIEVLP